MCDYSLMAIRNRLAVKGEDLVVHRFPTGSMGFASPRNLDGVGYEDASPRKWRILGQFLKRGVVDGVPAVCVPPGAQLVLRDISRELQRELQLEPVEAVTFTQLTAAANTYRDAVRFKNDQTLLLQRLREGQRAKVLAVAEILETRRSVSKEYCLERETLVEAQHV